jgi:hypothetical protein
MNQEPGPRNLSAAIAVHTPTLCEQSRAENAKNAHSNSIEASHYKIINIALVSVL